MSLITCAAVYEVAIDSLLKSHTNALGKDDRSALRDTRAIRHNILDFCVRELVTLDGVE